MEKRQIILAGESINYTLRRSARARWVRLDVLPGGLVVVTVPHRLAESLGEKFLSQKSKWVVRNVARLKNFKEGPLARHSRAHYQKHKEVARELINQRLEYFNNIYGFRYKGVSIRNQKTLWGSCSKKKNLNFNYKVLFLPERARDYIIVHELCHLKEFNHSARFWDLVVRTIPAHKSIRKSLNHQNLRLN